MTAAYFENHPTDPEKVVLRKPQHNWARPEQEQRINDAVAVEREACAMLCETPIDEIQITDNCAETVYMDATECAAAIRARNNHD